MALDLVWTPRAEKGFYDIVSYLEENWTEREVRRFVQRIFRFLDLLTEKPYLLQEMGIGNKLYRGPLDEHNMISYRVFPRKKQIVILNIRSAKRRPGN